MIEKIYKFLFNIKKDSLLHFICGLIISQISIIIINSIFNISYGGAIIGFFISIIAGIGKEIYDKYTPGHSSNIKDFFFTICGGFVGSILTIHFII